MCVQIAPPKSRVKIIPNYDFTYGENITQKTTNPTNPIKDSPMALFVSSMISSQNNCYLTYDTILRIDILCLKNSC